MSWQPLLANGLLSSEESQQSLNQQPLETIVSTLEIIIVIFWKRLLSGVFQFFFVAMFGGLVEIELWGLKGRSFYKLKIVITRKLAGQPKEGFLKVVVGLCRNVIVLQVLLAMEGDLLCLDLSVLDFDLVSSQYDWDVFTNSGQVTVPIWDILVRDTRCNVKHDDCALALDVVSVSKPSEFLPKQSDNVSFALYWFQPPHFMLQHGSLTSCPAVSQTLNLIGPRLVWNNKG
jgi:hypothetical protein